MSTATRYNPPPVYRPAMRFACYADDADARIRIIAQSWDEAYRIAARHFRCSSEYVVVRYISTISMGYQV